MSEADRVENAVDGIDVATSPTFAALLEQLIRLTKHEDGRPFTKPEIAEDLRAHGFKVSKSHLYGLLNGGSKPSLEIAQDLAEYFGVDLEYFGTGPRGRELQRQYELLSRFSEQGVRDIAFRASALPADKLASVLDYIEFQASRDKDDNHTSG